MIKKVRKLHNPFVSTNLRVKSGRQSSLEWHESLMQNPDELEEFVEQAGSQFPKKIFLISTILVFLGLFARLFFLQIIHGEYYQALADGNRTRKLILPAPRGLILDRFDKPLVANRASFNLVALPYDYPKFLEHNQLGKIADMFGLSPDWLKQTLSNTKKYAYEPVIIKTNLSSEERLKFETQAGSFPGFQVLTVPVREYSQPLIYAHLLGYTSKISETEYNQANTMLYDRSDIVGKSGLEQKYENFLKGLNGRLEVEVDASGKMLKTLGETLPAPGNTLITNIDKDLQEEIYKYFSVGKNGNKGVVGALDPQTGEVLALLSLPGFDANLFAGGIKEEEYQKLLGDPGLSLFNRAVAGLYPPGSTVKPMVGLAALEENIITPTTTVVDRGKLVIPNQFNPGITYDFVGWKRDGLGVVNVNRAIALSSDIFFYIVAGGHPSSNIRSLGVKRLTDWYRRFNLGKTTGIDLPGEKTGVVADPAWKSGYFKNDAVMSKWYLGDTYHIGIGQGDMLVTPLQVLLWTAAIGNDGVGMKPRIIRSVKDVLGKEIYASTPEVLIPQLGSKDHLTTVKAGMRETVLYGSGRQLLDLPVDCAGKTGTSQFDGSDPKKTHAWFSVFCPLNNPRLALVVLVEAGGEGNAAAVPVAKNVIKWWAENRYLQK